DPFRRRRAQVTSAGYGFRYIKGTQLKALADAERVTIAASTGPRPPSAAIFPSRDFIIAVPEARFAVASVKRGLIAAGRALHPGRGIGISGGQGMLRRGSRGG